MKEKLLPSLRRITLKQLRAFSAVNQAGTISGAARILNLTPPAVSLQLHLLEETTAMALFERSKNGMLATEAGKLLLDVTEQIETALGEFGDALDGLRGGDVGHVDVGIISTAKYFAPRALAEFVKSYPNVNMRLQVGNRGEMISSLEHHKLDFVIMGLPPAELEVDKVMIGDHPHIVIAPPDHPKVGKKIISLRNLTNDTFLLRESSSGTRLLMQRLFDEAGLNPNMGLEIGSNETIKQAVMAGLGIAVISADTVHRELYDGRLCELKVTGLPVIRQWYLAKLKKKRLQPAARALWDHIINTTGKYLAANRI
jgi:DNA-binding transcriptional LysR family regulator